MSTKLLLFFFLLAQPVWAILFVTLGLVDWSRMKSFNLLFFSDFSKHWVERLINMINNRTKITQQKILPDLLGMMPRWPMHAMNIGSQVAEYNIHMTMQLNVFSKYCNKYPCNEIYGRHPCDITTGTAVHNKYVIYSKGV